MPCFIIPKYPVTFTLLIWITSPNRTTNVKLDIAKFAHLKQLELLKLRGVCGLLMPEFSFSGGLSELCDLKALKTLVRFFFQIN